MSVCTSVTSTALASAFETASAGRALSRSEARSLLDFFNGDLLGLLDLVAAARLAARRPVQAGSERAEAGKPPRPFTCGIINAKSGRCAENCSFCAQSGYHATAAPVYPLIANEKLLERAELLADNGVDYMGIVISGTGPTPGDFERICVVAGRIRARTGIRLCASLGILKPEQAASLKQAGFTSYHHNLETARSYYGQICSTHGIELRERTVQNARAAGLRVCSGGIFGLGESWEQRLEMAETLQELAVDSIPLNFLNPIPGTPLEKAKPLSPEEALGSIAMFRLLHPDRDIVICGGRGRALGAWENLLFSAGANGLMVGDYLTTKGSPFEKDLELLRVLGIRHD